MPLVVPSVIAFAVWPIASYANVVWPALYLEMRVLTWWAILSGLLVEFLFLWKFLRLPIKRAGVAAIAMNAGSTILGILLIPLAGIAWEFFPGSFLYPLLDVGTFSPVTWAATFVFAVLINACTEGFVLWKLFKLPWARKLFWGLAAVNSISVGIALGSLFIVPVRG